MVQSLSLQRDPERYAARIKEIKGSTGENLADILPAIDRALDTVYRAVALDIDGTLTQPGEDRLDDDVADAVRRMVRRGIPVILVTGRGLDSALVAVRALQARQLDQSPGRLHAVVRNGAGLLTPAVPGGDLVFEPLVPDDLDVRVWEALDELSVLPDDHQPRITDPQKGTLRLHYENAADRDIAAEELRAKLEPLGFVVMTSVYGPLFNIDVGTITKRKALEDLVGRLGLEPEEVLRIGDQGAPGGNDADLLDSIAGFSVGSTSLNPATCHPVITADDELIVGVPATICLLDGAHLSPPVKRIHSTISDDVVRRIGQVERAARAASAATEQQVESAIANSLLALVDRHTGLVGPSNVRLGELFDPLSGAVRLRDYELDELRLEPGHPAETMFDPDGAHSLPPTSAFVMTSDSSLLLRGRLYYYGYTSTPTPQRVGNYMKLALSFVEDAERVVRAIGIEAVPPHLTRLKLVWGVADHVRNFLLQILQIAWVVESQTSEFSVVASTTTAALKHTAAHLRILTANTELWDSALARYADELVDLREFFEKVANSDLAETDETKFDKPLIRIRECDSFIQNVAAVDLALRHHARRMALRRGDHVTCFGLPYGGIELPLIASVLGKNFDLDISAGFLQASTYEDKKRGDQLRSSKATSVRALTEGNVRWPGGTELGSVLIADDNTTTAGTLQLAVDLLAIEGVDAAGAILVQYPMPNRREHMRLFGHGCVDPDALLTFIRGLVAPTPFTRLLEPGDGDDLYRDRAKVFNKAKDRVESLLFKNGLSLDSAHPLAAQDVVQTERPSFLGRLKRSRR